MNDHPAQTGRDGKLSECAIILDGFILPADRRLNFSPFTSRNPLRIFISNIYNYTWHTLQYITSMIYL